MPRHHRAGGQALLHQRAGRLELGRREGALGRGLDNHLDAVLLAQLARRRRG